MREHYDRSIQGDSEYEGSGVVSEYHDPSLLREDQIEILRSYGHTIQTEAGQVLFRAGRSVLRIPITRVICGERSAHAVRGSVGS